VSFALLRRSPDIALSGSGSAWLERAPAPLGIVPSIEADVGIVIGVAAVAGAVLSFFVAKDRVTPVALGGVALAGALALATNAPAGPDRWAAPVLAAIVAAYVASIVVLASVVIVIARARVPFAEASAAFVVLLELALPVRALDETGARRDARVGHAADVWTDVAWGPLPPASVVVVQDRPTMARVVAARATGAMRGDLLVVPAFNVQGRAGQRALAAEPKLAPLYRDVALGIAPEELSFAQLGAERPVVTAFDPSWDRALARHLVPVGLMARLEPEPRGASDRRAALEAFASARDRLVRVAVAKKDPVLARATATLLRARAIGMAATGERDVVERSLDDLRIFSPNDPVDAKLVRRLLTTKGPIDVRDLTP
jgi:hypothetical protein